MDLNEGGGDAAVLAVENVEGGDRVDGVHDVDDDPALLERLDDARVEPGAFVTIQSDPVVINRLGVRVHLHRVEWISVEGPNGSEEKEGTAHLIVERSGADKSIQLDEGETKSALGVSVTVQKVSEEYDKDKLDFRPLVTLKVE